MFLCCKNELIKQPRRTHFLLATPLLQWYLKHGLVVSHIYQIICREGDVHPDKTVIAETMKPIGNGAYGKCATDKANHKDVFFCNTKAASWGIKSHRFRQLEPISESVYRLTLSKKIN